MRIMLDTNVIISAVVFGGRTGRLLRSLLASEHKVFVSEYVDREFHDKLKQKWPEISFETYAFYRSMRFIFCESSSTVEDSVELRDKKDIPVMRDALYHDVDILLTGYKDFLDSAVKKPIIFSPSMMADFLHVD